MEVAAWLRDLGLERYAAAFQDAEITPEALPELTDADLRELGLPLGPRKVLLRAIRVLTDPPPPPVGIKEEAAPQRAAIGSSQAERRQLTVMFVDLVGSTALSSRLDPEELRHVLRAYQDAVEGEIVRYDGHVAKYLGDGVLAYFGYPQAQEDDAERAVRAGVAIVATVGRLPPPAGEAPPAARVGIATGLVVVGDLLGEGAAREEAVVGETPNLAARLQEAASPGAVVVADGTRRLLGEVFDLRPLGPIRLKGIARPVPCYRVVDERPADSRFEAHRSGRLLPMVGREQELALVQERWRQAAAGEGQAVLLVGEAGIGKSRLVRAVLDALAGEEHTALRYQCSPHHTGTALWPVTQQLAIAADFASGQARNARLDRLETLLRQGADDVGEVVPLVAALLGIDVSDRYPTRELSSQQERLLTLAALVEQLLGLAHRRAVLMVLEDAHWIDPTTLELVDLALDRIGGARVLLLLTSRPDRQPNLGGHPHVTRLTLNRLGRGATEAIVSGLAGEGGLSPAVLTEIAARADGVPLFVEELTKAVLEAGAGRATAVVPASLHASLMARLDRVPGVKEVAQAAACIGREFAYPLLAAVSPASEPELRAALDRLAAAELVFARGQPPEASYAFKHALVRDAAYQSLLKSRRQQLHARIAETLEERFPETAAAEPELLARHYAGAGLAEPAIKQWQRAAELAIGRSANIEAIAHCDQAEAELRALPPSSERARTELEVQLTKGVAVRAAKGFSAPEMEPLFRRACELCEQLGDRLRLVYALRGLWVLYYAAGRWQDAARFAARLEETADILPDGVAGTVRDYVTGTTLLFRGDPVVASVHLQRALSLYDESDREAHLAHSGFDAPSLLCVHLALAQWLCGLPDQARRTSDQGLAIARVVGRPLSLSGTLTFRAVLLALVGDWRMALAAATEAREFCASHGLPYDGALATVVVGMATAGLGRDAQGIGHIREGVAMQRRLNGRVFLPLALSRLALAQCASGEMNAALEAAEEAVHVAREGEEFCWEAETLRVRGEVKLAMRVHDVAEVEADVSAAVAIANRQAAKSFELRAATSLARLWHGRGRPGDARNILAPIYTWFTEGFGTPDLIEAKALLDALC